MTFQMGFYTLRNLVGFFCVVSFTSQRGSMHQRRSFATSTLPTSVIENESIREETLLAPSEMPAFSTSDGPVLPLNEYGLSQQRESTRLLYQHLVKMHKPATNPGEGSVFESLLSHAKEHSENPSKKPRLREVLSVEGSSGSAAAHYEDKDALGGHMYAQHSIPQTSSTTLVEIPMQQTEMIKASNQERSPNTSEIGYEEGLSVDLNSPSAWQPRKTSLQAQLGYHDQLDQHQGGLSKQTPNRILYRLLLKDRMLKERERASAPSEVCLPYDAGPEFLPSHNKEHSITTSKKPWTREELSAEGSLGAQSGMQHSLPQRSSIIASGISRQQTEMIRPCEEDLPLNRGSPTALQPRKNLLQAQLEYDVSRDYQGGLSKQTPNRILYRGLLKERMLKERERASAPSEVSLPYDAGPEFFLSHSRGHSTTQSKKPWVCEEVLPEGSPGLAQATAQDTNTMGAQSSMQHSIPQRSSTTVAGISIQQTEMIIPTTQGSSSSMKEIGCEEEPPVNQDSSSAIQSPENTLEAHVLYDIDHDRHLRLGQHGELPILGTEVAPGTETTPDPRQFWDYPSRILAWEPGPINPKIAHGAELFSKELSDTLPSAFDFLNQQSQRQKIHISWKEPANRILLPLVYELLMKGIAKPQWSRVHRIWEDFWEICLPRVQTMESPVPIFLWFCEFICEATIPKLFSNLPSGEKLAKKSKHQSASESAHYSGWICRLIRYISIGDNSKFILSTRSRIKAIEHLYQLGEKECSEAVKTTQFVNSQELTKNLGERLKIKAEEIRSVSYPLWRAYQGLADSAGGLWKNAFKNYSLNLASSIDLKWEQLLAACLPNEREVVRNISEYNEAEESFPMSLRLNHVPPDPDDLLERFEAYERACSHQEKIGIKIFLPERMHAFFEGEDERYI